METSSSIRRRSRRPALSRGDEREIALLDTADRLLSEGKFDSTTLEEIAASAGISRPTFYFYFDSKQALLVGVVERTLDELTGQIIQVIRPNGDEPARAMRALMRGVAELWWEHRGALMAAAELAGSAPSIFERIRLVIESPMRDVAKLLHGIGGSRLTRTMRTSERLALRIGWMTERNFYVLARENPSKRQLYALADDLAEIALAAAGYSD
jgi:TetR/AcrR family transcriptional regulator, ethionamide resistance regulator